MKKYLLTWKKYPVWVVALQNRSILVAILESIKVSTQEEMWFNALKIIEQGPIFSNQEISYTRRKPEPREPGFGSHSSIETNSAVMLTKWFHRVELTTTRIITRGEKAMVTTTHIIITATIIVTTTTTSQTLLLYH